MAELLGIVAGGAGLASLALQLVDGGQKLRQRYKNVKGFGGNITWLSEDVELIGKQLMQLEASADDIMQEQLGPIMMGRCRDRSIRVADRLTNLAGGIPETSSRRQIIRTTFRSSQWKGELDDLQVFVTGLKQDISQYTTPPLSAIETVVDFDAPGFVILEKLAFEEIDWATAEIEFKDLYKACPGFQAQEMMVLYGGYEGPIFSLTALGCDFANAGPTRDVWNLPYTCRDDPFHLHFTKTLLAVNSKDVQDFGDNPPLHTSLLFGSDEDFKFCLERNTQPFEKVVNFRGQSAFHIAVFQPSRVAQLLAAGHPVDLSDENGTTPLIYAATANVPDSVMILIENGAKLLLPVTGHTIFHEGVWPDWNVVWQIIDFASASHPNLIPRLFKDLLLHSRIFVDKECYSAHVSDFQDGCINFWSRVVSTLGSPNFAFDDGTTLMHMTRDSQSARALMKLGFTEFNQKMGDLLLHLSSLHDPFLFQIAFANGGDALLQTGWGWDVTDRLLHDLETCSWKEFPESLETLRFILDKGVQFPPRDNCVYINHAPKWMACSLRAFAWLEVSERHGAMERVKQVSLTLLRQMYFDQAGLHHTCCTMCNSDLAYDINDRFWDISEQISLDALNLKITGLSKKPYPVLKIEVMVGVRDVWKRKCAEQWPEPRLAPNLRSAIQSDRAEDLMELLKVIRTSKHPKIPEPFSSHWDRIVEKKLESDHWTLEYDLELGVVKLGVGLYRCGGDQFESWLPLLTQLTEVLLAEESVASES
ncbi:uncharacterized protein FTJAE_3423 [Fusarium tjaetaba]|uniref:Ankyrin n=1 Tax=Fusarium tjaetaba TaxID=1567544 RepID=A0A8H5RXX5_9HYPO|nr:uncharacterized protein FTJAE_3423 [Fusarium tjaetaba]KAF5642881.1 hypothetical protein FTJAE_3423 [Fusarium tjaetaba]